MAAKASQDPRKQQKHTPGWLQDMRYGRTVSLEFFRRNAWIITVFLVAVLALMGLRYKTKTKMEQIKSLNKELTLAESTMLKEKAEYMSLIREAEMKRMIDEKGLGLQYQEEPPIHLKASDKK